MNPRTELMAVLGAVAAACVLVAGLVKETERRRGAAFALAWLIPGAGHIFLGRWKKGLCFLGLLGATYVAGLWIVGFRPVSFDDNPFYYVGQYGSGATFFLARALGAGKAYPRDENPGWFDPGLLYACVVGLLNLVVMLNVLDLKLAPPPVKPVEGAAVGVPPALGGGPGPAPEKTA